MWPSRPIASGREVALRLELVPDLLVLARLDGGEPGVFDRQEALTRDHRRAGRPYRTSIPYRHLDACATGEHRFAAVEYTFVVPSAPACELTLAERDLHELRVHGLEPAPEILEFVARLPALGTGERDNRVWLERLWVATTLESRADLVLDLCAAWGQGNRRTVSLRGVAMNECGAADTVGWRHSARASVYRTRMRQTLASDPAGAARAMQALTALMWSEGGIAAVPACRLVAVLRELGAVETRHAASAN